MKANLLKLMAICLLLVVSAYLGWRTYHLADFVAPTAPLVQQNNEIGAIGQLSPPANFTPQPFESYSYIQSSQVLFRSRRFASKREVVVPKPAASAPAPTTEGFEIFGVISREGEPQALLKAPSAEARWYKIGEKVGEWTVSEITNDNVVLQSSTGKSSLKLYK